MVNNINKCINKNSVLYPTYDSMIVHRNSYFNKVKSNMDKVCLNCKYWDITVVAMGKCLNNSEFSYYTNEQTWYTHSCNLCYIERV